MKRHWMPLYIADYLADTAHLSMTEHGAYLLLIMHYWSRGAPPESDEIARRITRLSARQWEKSAPILRSLFLSGWRHKRIDSELAQVAEKSRAASANARKSHEARKQVADIQQSTITSHHQRQSQTSDNILRVDNDEAVNLLVTTFLEAAGLSAVPPNWSELPQRASKWIEAGYSTQMIAAEARKLTSGSSRPKPLLYFEKVFATAFARAVQPLPIAVMPDLEKIYVKRARRSGQDISDELDREIARTRRAAEDDRVGGIGASEGIPRLLPPRRID